MLQRSISKLSRLCVNQDAKIATIRATLVAVLLASLLLMLMSMSSAAETTVAHDQDSGSALSAPGSTSAD